MSEIDKLNGAIDGLEFSIKKHENYIRENKRLVIKNTIERNNLMTGLSESERLAVKIAKVKSTVEEMELELSEMKKVEEVGGELTTGKMPITGVGWLAYCKDSEGNTFGMMEMDPSAVSGAQ